MKNKYNKGIATLAAMAIVALGGLLAGYVGSKVEKQTDPNVAGTFQTPEVRALFETSLASKITSSATSFTLTSATDKDGTVLASSTYGFIIDEGQSNEEMVLADCTGTTCTNATRGLSVRTGTTTISALQSEHRRGASVKITDGPGLIFTLNVFKGLQNIENPLTYNANFAVSSTSRQILAAYQGLGMANTASTSARLTVLDGNNTFSGLMTLSATNIHIFGSQPTLTDDKHVATKKYVDDASLGAFSVLTVTKATSTNATSTDSLFGLRITGGSLAIGTTGTSTINNTGDLLVVGSTTLQHFTARNSTSTSATTTNFHNSGLASTTDFRTNTATIGTLTTGSCSGCGGASNVLTLFPYSPGYTGATSSIPLASNTTMSVGQVLVNFPIRVNTLMLKTGDVAGTETVDVTLYSEDGQTQLFSVTSGTLSGIKATSTIAVSNVLLNQGVYYLGVNPNTGSTALEITMQSLDPAGTSPNAFAGWNKVSGDTKIQGTLTISAGAPPATITPTAIVDSNLTQTLMVRLDN